MFKEHTHTQLYTYSGTKSQWFKFQLRHKLRRSKRTDSLSGGYLFKWKHPLRGINGSILLCIIIISRNECYTTSFMQSSGSLSVSIMTSLAKAKSFMQRYECAHTLFQAIPSLHTHLSIRFPGVFHISFARLVTVQKCISCSVTSSLLNLIGDSNNCPIQYSGLSSMSAYSTKYTPTVLLQQVLHFYFCYSGSITFLWFSLSGHCTCRVGTECR